MYNEYKPDMLNSGEYREYTELEIADAYRNKSVLSSTVTHVDLNGNAVVWLGKNMKGYIAYENIQVIGKEAIDSKRGYIKELVGETVSFVVTSINGSSVELSRRLATVKCYDEYISKLEVGTVIMAAKKWRMDHSLICDIGCGVEAMLMARGVAVNSTSIDELRSVPSSFKAIITKNEGPGSILISTRELLGTWEENANKYEIGDVLLGRAKWKKSNTIIVELGPNCSCLLLEPCGVKEGDDVVVSIKYKNPAEAKIMADLVKKAPQGSYKRSYEFDNYNVGERVDSWIYAPESHLGIRSTFE